jgi:catechol 2,3-dioxygenase-like lactoylglutathione lyase family enzyme
MKLDHIYVSVTDMDRAIAFYEDLLEMKVVHREENQWADFDLGNEV